jgi:hypothetical protein
MVEVEGQSLRVGFNGRLYQVNQSGDKETTRATKYRIVRCECGQSFIAHDGRMKTCEACKAKAKQERLSTLTYQRQEHHQTCQHCGQPIQSERSTKRFCSAKCKVAYHRSQQQEQAA